MPPGGVPQLAYSATWLPSRVQTSVKASGASVDIHMGQVWTLRNGKAVRWRIYRTKAEALAAVGATT